MMKKLDKIEISFIHPWRKLHKVSATIHRNPPQLHKDQIKVFKRFIAPADVDALH